mmetsp:Transcript_4579/g.5300  ORF Transcript_4579/g.5300 Transcript_4579/m.5300 type:complete len:899 (+) Transcript_4579:43-2739(+)
MLLFGITCNAKVDGQTYSLDELVSVLKANFEPPKVVFSETEKLKLRYVTGNIIKYQTEIKKIFESDVLEDQLAFPFQEVMRTGDTFKAFLQVHKENADLINLASDIIAGISQLAANPVVMKWLAYHVVDPTKKKLLGLNHLLFTFVLRQILARLLFQTRLNVAVYTAVRTYIESTKVGQYPMQYFTTQNGGKLMNEAGAYEISKEKTHEIEFEIKDIPENNAWYSIVGFNRIFSPNNTVGVSLSSDLDYKFVLETAMFQMKEDGGPITKEATKELVEVIQAAMAAEKEDYFDTQACMFLEVADFTTKTIIGFKADVGNVEAEKNFAASIYLNNVWVTGHKKVYETFRSILSKELNVDEIAKRTWTQYLGESDKGSIMIIKELAKIKAATDQCATETVAFITDYASAFSKETKIQWPVGKTAKDEIARLIIASTPHNMQWVFKHAEKLQKKSKNGEKPLDEYKTSLSDRAKDTNAAVVDQFKFGPQSGLKNLNGALRDAPYDDDTKVDRDASKRIKLFAKLLASQVTGEFIDMVDKDKKATIEYIHLQHQSGYSKAHLCLIGSTYVSSDITTSYKFSLKYGLCRLADFNDSVSDSLFAIWWGNNQVSPYVFCKEIAKSLNWFALKMQTSIYLLATNQDFLHQEKKARHTQIDELYSFISRAQYLEMIIEKEKILIEGPGNTMVSPEDPSYVVDMPKILDTLSKELNQAVSKLGTGKQIPPHFWKVIKSIEDVTKAITEQQKGIVFFRTSKHEEKTQEEKTQEIDDGRDFWYKLFCVTDAAANLLNPKNLNVANTHSIHVGNRLNKNASARLNKNSSASGAVRMMEDMFGNLGMSVADLEARNAHLEAQNSLVETQNEHLENQNAHLETQNRNLQDDNYHLRRENAELRSPAEDQNPIWV